MAGLNRDRQDISHHRTPQRLDRDSCQPLRTARSFNVVNPISSESSICFTPACRKTGKPKYRFDESTSDPALSSHRITGKYQARRGAASTEFFEKLAFQPG